MLLVHKQQSTSNFIWQAEFVSGSSTRSQSALSGYNVIRRKMFYLFPNWTVHLSFQVSEGAKEAVAGAFFRARMETPKWFIEKFLSSKSNGRVGRYCWGREMNSDLVATVNNVILGLGINLKIFYFLPKIFSLNPYKASVFYLALPLRDPLSKYYLQTYSFCMLLNDPPKRRISPPCCI